MGRLQGDAKMRPGNRDLIKQINHNITLNLIKSQGPLSRTDIARLSGLSLATISGLTGELLATGFIQEVGEGESKGGRPPVLLKLNPEGGFVVGVKLMEDSIVTAVADLEANVVGAKRLPVAGLTDPVTGMRALIQAIEQALAETDVPRARMMGIGIGMSGIVDSQAGVLHYSPHLRWRDVPVVGRLEKHFGLPVYIENDVNTLTVAEQWFGAGRGREHLLVLTIGLGIGAGIVVNGQLYHGAFGGAGEVGHLTLQEDGPLCRCGKHGCLESFASDLAMTRMAAEAIAAGRATKLPSGAHLTLDMVAEAAAAGDQLANEMMRRAAHALGLAMSHLVNLFNPQLIVLTGDSARAAQMMVGPARVTMSKNIFDGLEEGLTVVVESLGDEAWARGAACVVLSELFKHPIHKDERAMFAPRVA